MLVNAGIWEATVEASFDITDRGVAVVFGSDRRDLPFGQTVIAEVSTPGCAPSCVKATREWLLRTSATPDERAALLLYEATRQDAPPGARIRVGTRVQTNVDAALAGLRAALAALTGAQLAPPWIAVSRGNLEEELRREVPPGHALHGVLVRAVGRRDDADTVLFVTTREDAPLAVVHLTWRAEADPRWPAVDLLPSIEAWWARHEEDANTFSQT
ncbi:MAG: hypothetical protein V4850_32770 [Myxococcota bacterium]